MHPKPPRMQILLKPAFSYLKEFSSLKIIMAHLRIPPQRIPMLREKIMEKEPPKRWPHPRTAVWPAATRKRKHNVLTRL